MPCRATLTTALLVLAFILPQTSLAGHYCGIEWTEDRVAEVSAPTFGPEAPYMVAPSRNFDTLHTRLDLDVDLAAKSVAGSVTHTVKILRPDVQRIELNCVDLTVSDVSIAVEDVRQQAATAVSGWSQYEDLNSRGHKLIIELSPPPAFGALLDLRIEYHGNPTYGLFFIAEEGGQANRRLEAWSQGEGENNRHWIPSFDYPNDKATYDGIFRVAKGQFALSNGMLVDERDLGDKVEYHWQLDTPQVNYLIMLAVSEYEIHRDEWQGMELMYLVPPGTGAETVQRCYGKTPAMLSFFNDTIGIDYPFKKYAQVVVQDFIVGGMENTTAVVMNERSLFDARAQLTRDADSLIAHELAHMWWGDMVTMREWNDMWLNEGFATYYEKLWLAEDHGDDAFRLAMMGTHESVTRRDDNNPLPMVVDFFNRTSGRSNANIYVKGSSVLHMLRHQLGDELFHEVVRHYGNDRKYDFAETADLMRAVKEVTGENLDWFFEQWVYMAGHPKLEVSKRWDKASGMLTLTVMQTQEVKDLVPLFRLPIDVEMTTDNSVQLFSIMVDQAEQQFHFYLSDEPRMVIFDQGDWTLKTLTFKKNKAELLYQLEHGDAVSKSRAIEGLKKYRTDADVVAALTAVVHGDWNYRLRQEAIGLYTDFTSDKTVELLLSALDSEEAHVRLTAAERAQHARGNQAVEDKLYAMLLEEPSYTIRARCVSSLVGMGSELALKASLEALSQESDRGEVRIAGINGLSNLKAVEQLAELAPYCGRGNSRWYRHTAMRTYARLAARLEDDAERAQAAEFLIEMLGDSYHRTREAAIGALQTLGEKTAIEALRSHALTEHMSWIADQAEGAANRLEAQTSEEQSIEDLETQIKELEDELSEIERRLGALDKRVGH